MVCEFLSVKYKQQLLEIATVDELMESGFTKAGAYKAKETGVISDEKCEKLVEILGEKARPVLLQALREFASKLNCEVKC
jgi:hypothetical protein